MNSHKPGNCKSILPFASWYQVGNDPKFLGMCWGSLNGNHRRWLFRIPTHSLPIQAGCYTPNAVAHSIMPFELAGEKAGRVRVGFEDPRQGGVDDWDLGFERVSGFYPGLQTTDAF